jgi:hypothetical protein
MPESLDWMLVAAIALAFAGVLLVVGGLVALARARPLRFALRTLTGLLLLATGALAAAISFGMQGYRALTHEEVAARISVQPLGTQRFAAEVRLADGRRARYELAGDEIYVDAHILKWRPIFNIAGLHTAYELDRIAGRYHVLADERAAARTVHSLNEERPIDLFSLRRRHTFLAPLVDAEYGSATFVPVSRPMELEVRVSTTGLLIREERP